MPATGWESGHRSEIDLYYLLSRAELPEARLHTLPDTMGKPHSLKGIMPGTSHLDALESRISDRECVEVG